MIHKFKKIIELSFVKKELKDVELVEDILIISNKLGISLDVVANILKEYRPYLIEINNLLYTNLSLSDKDLFVRFLLKRYYGIDTGTKEELALIDENFTIVENIYVEKCRPDNSIEFTFRGNKVKYYSPAKNAKGENNAEVRLLNYYDVTHAFFLTEYEKDGYNPNDGETIFDCGAAYGDTALMFATLYPHSKIYSFEYSKEQFSYLQKNIRVNNIEDRVKAINTFLYADSKEHILNKNYEIKEIKDGDEVQGDHIETTSIDDYVKRHNIRNIGLIKFDIEGGEQDALLGCVNTIKRYKPLLYIPIYHRKDDIYKIPIFLNSLSMKMSISLKWTEKKVWGVDCVLFVKFL